MTSITAISPVNFQNVNFRANENQQTTKNSQDYQVLTYQTEGSTGKKWGVGIASLFIPGLGQAINGQWGKGIGFFLGEVVTEILASFALAKPSIGITGAVLGLGNRIWSIVDAVKNAKSEVQQIVPKNQTEENKFSATA